MWPASLASLQTASGEERSGGITLFHREALLASPLPVSRREQAGLVSTPE
ncbi:hypothetical protein [Aeromonas simiae]|nr:hypothetical protein [Aeromonas simiae]MDO2950319.1 hypothetical protein [Aeromonas simiae]MDO2954003.1 hypothetical protein [Aeromonas simiae]MDO2957742.1 hypothetical protein [Aeromonas simiae]